MTSCLQATIFTWTNVQNQNLFDYHDQNIPKSKKTIKTSGSLLRKTDDFFQVIFVEEGQDPQELEKRQKLFFVAIRGNTIQINDFKNEKQPLQLIVPTLAEKALGKNLQLNEQSKFRVGKIQFKVQKVFWQKRVVKSHYMEEKLDEPSKMSKILEEFYSYSPQSQTTKFSMIEDNPACRYCYSKTISDQNIFRILCNCQGSAKYIHEVCLTQWINMRTKIIHNEDKSIYMASMKGFYCEICKTMFPIEKILNFLSHKRQDMQFQPINQLRNYFILSNVKQGQKMLYIIDMDKTKQIKMGRNHTSDITVSDLSVSRKHCRILIEDKKILIFDQKSKFGTRIKQSSLKIKDKDKVRVQKGRTIFQLKKAQKKSLFLSVFCKGKEQQSQ